jgi:hypothetical protein
MIQKVLRSCFAVGTIWNGITIWLGISVLIDGQTLLGYSYCAVGALLIAGLGIGTRQVFTEAGIPFAVLKLLWVVGIVFGAFASFIGNIRHIILRKPVYALLDMIGSMSVPQLLVAVSVTIAVSSAPIVLSYLWTD